MAPPQTAYLFPSSSRGTACCSTSFLACQWWGWYSRQEQWSYIWCLLLLLPHLPRRLFRPPRLPCWQILPSSLPSWAEVRSLGGKRITNVTVMDFLLVCFVSPSWFQFLVFVVLPSTVSCHFIFAQQNRENKFRKKKSVLGFLDNRTV